MPAGSMFSALAAALALAGQISALPVAQGTPDTAATALALAAGRSILKGNTVVAGPLRGLTLGANVTDTAGHPIGNVEQILAGRNRVVNGVLVRSISGKRVIRLSAADVSFDGSTLIATIRDRDRDRDRDRED